jgi:hypothetical protein
MTRSTTHSLLQIARLLLIVAAVFAAALNSYVLVAFPRLAELFRLAFASFLAASLGFLVHLVAGPARAALSRTAGLASSVFALIGLVLLLLATRAPG